MGAYVTQTQIGDTEITGSGTANTWAMFTGAQSIGNSMASQNGAATIGTIAGSLVLTPVAAATGVLTLATFTMAANTNQTASTEISSVNLNLSATREWATGAITTQREFLIQAPTYAFVGASTITSAATLAISGPPVAGTNATLTSTDSLWIQAGTQRMDNAIRWTTAISAPTAEYAIFRGGGGGNPNRTQMNAPTGFLVMLSIAGTSRYHLSDTTHTVSQGIATTGSPTFVVLTAGAHTTLAASTEAIDINYNLARTVQFATGALTTQRAFLVQAPTYGFVAASTITNAATFAISAAPTAGTNATITNSYSLWVQAGTSKLDGTLSVLGTGSLITSTATATGALTLLTLTSVAHTNQTAGTEISSTNFNLSATREWATGAITTQREFLVQGPTYAFVGASTITNAATVVINGAPTEGANATITNSYALWLQGGRLRMDAAIRWVIATAIVGAQYTIQIDSGDVNNPLAYNVPTGVAHVFAVAGTSRLSVLSSTTIDAQLAATSGNPTYWLHTGGAHTGLTASAEIIDINYNLARTVQRGTGAVATQRAFLIQAPTYSFVAASTITNAATFAISAAPTAGTNATITNSYSLWVQAGTTRLDGTLSVLGTGSLITSTAASTGALTLLTLTSVAHTNQTASTEISSMNFNLAATREWAAGAITTQREFLVQAPTYAFVTASTITNAATVAITGGPVAGTNATITNANALWVQAGRSVFDGIVIIRATGTANTLRVVNLTGGTTPSNYLTLVGATANNTNFPAIEFEGGTVPTTYGNIGSNNSGQGLTMRSGSSAGVAQFPGLFLFSNTAAGTAYVSFQMAGTGHMQVFGNSNIIIGSSSTTTAASATRTIHLVSGVAPTGNIADASLIYTEDVTAGNAAIHTRAENSEIMYFGSLFGMRSNHALNIATNNVSRAIISAIGNVTLTPGVSTSGALTGFTFTGAANTGQTASTQINGILFTTTSREWATGAITTQREFLITAPTYSFVAASTITTAATFAISAAPTAGTNATITTSLALWVQAGQARFGGRLVETQGADVASATNLTLGTDGNSFEITGVTTVDLISIVEWQNGAIITLIFNESLTVRHAIATSGNNVTILLAGAANFSASANDTLTFILSETTAGGQAWRELARTAI